MNARHSLRLTAAFFVAVCATAAHALDEAPLNAVEATATVLGIAETKGEACGPPAEDAHHVIWGLRAGKTKFRFTKKTDVVFRIKRLTSEEDPDMEVASFFAFNKKKNPTKDYACQNTASLQKYPFAFAIHDLEDPHKPGTKSPHALLYIPSRHKRETQENLADSFDLLVYDIEKNASNCTSSDPEAKARCLALRELADLKDKVDETDFIVAIWGAIDAIRPPVKDTTPPFHNGVIHGSL